MQSFTNSSLISYKNLSKHYNIRNHDIDTLTIHCFVGQITAKQGCDYFANTDSSCSANYVIGWDGSIGLCVEECCRSWCSSDAKNDHRAITIEVASDTENPYKITQQAYIALVELLVDVCKRNNIDKLRWKADKNLIGKTDIQNITVHRWFANKDCPGDYIYNNIDKIVCDVNSKLDASVLYKVQVGAFRSKENAEYLAKDLNNMGYDAFIIKSSRKENI